MHALSIERPDSSEILQAIGEVTAAHSLLEYVLKNLLALMLRELDSAKPGVSASILVVNCFADRLSSRDLRDVALGLFSVLHEGDNEGFQELKALMKDAAACSKERNEITHAMWLIGDTPTTRTRFQFRLGKKGLTATTKPYDAETIRSRSQSIHAVVRDIVSFSVRRVLTSNRAG